MKALWLPEAKQVYGLSAGKQSKPESWAEATDTAGHQTSSQADLRPSCSWEKDRIWVRISAASPNKFFSFDLGRWSAGLNLKEGKWTWEDFSMTWHYDHNISAEETREHWGDSVFKQHTTLASLKYIHHIYQTTIMPFQNFKMSVRPDVSFSVRVKWDR